MPHFFDTRALLARVGSSTPAFEVHVKLAKPEPERRRALAVSRPQTPAPRPSSREDGAWRNLGAHHEKLGTWMDGHAWLDTAARPQGEQGERRRERRLQDAARRARERERVERLKEREEERRREMRRREEMRRAEVRRRIDEERQRADERRREERRKVEERRRVERVRAERQRREEREERVGEAWRVYEARWAVLGAGADEGYPLVFGNVPWPVVDTPQRVEDIHPDMVQRFLLSSAHSADVQRRERIRRALRRWHPDKFSRVVDMVEEGEREKVMAGAAVVIRCLNEMLETENQVALAA